MNNQFVDNSNDIGREGREKSIPAHMPALL